MALEQTTQFANRSGLDLTFYKYDPTADSNGFKATGDGIKIEYANNCSLETSGDTVWATGGIGFDKLIGFDNPVEGSFTMDTQISDPRLWAMVIGEDPDDFDESEIKLNNDPTRKKNYWVVEGVTMYRDKAGVNHTQNITLCKAAFQRNLSLAYTGNGDPQSISLKLDLASNDSDTKDLVVFGFKDGETTGG